MSSTSVKMNESKLSAMLAFVSSAFSNHQLNPFQYNLFSEKLSLEACEDLAQVNYLLHTVVEFM